MAPPLGFGGSKYRIQWLSNAGIISRLAALKEDSSEYVRKSVGNALRDISKKFPDFIRKEVETWSLDSKEIKQVYHLVSKLIKKN